MDLVSMIASYFILLLFLFSCQLEEEQQELEFWRKNQPKENGQGKLDPTKPFI